MNKRIKLDNLNKAISSFLARYGVYIVLFFAFVPAFVNVVDSAYGPVENYGWNILYYHVGYETGFGGRKLLATFCHLIFPDFVKLRHIRAMVIAINIIMVVLFVLFAGGYLKKTKQQASLWIVLALYILGPFSIIPFMTSGLSVAFTETYQITLTLLWLLIWTKHRGRWPFYFATLIITAICCLQHHTFCCTLFPLYVGLFTYDIFNRDRLDFKSLVGYGTICAILLGLLIVIWKFSHMVVDIDQLNDWFNKHVAVDAYECSREAHTVYYYMTNAENRGRAADMLTLRYRYGEFICTLLLLSPLLVTVYYPWVRASHTAPSRLSSWRYRLSWIAVTVLTLPIFFMATDYNRWFVCFFFGMFAATAAVIAIGDRILRASVLRMAQWFTKRPIFMLALVFYLAAFHCTPFCQNFGLQESIELWEFVKSFLKIA